MLVVKLIQDGCDRQHQGYTLVSAIWRIYQDEGKVMCQHTCHKANQVAEVLAKSGIDQPIMSKIYDIAPNFLSLPLSVDATLVSFRRGF